MYGPALGHLQRCNQIAVSMAHPLVVYKDVIAVSMARPLIVYKDVIR